LVDGGIVDLEKAQSFGIENPGRQRIVSEKQAEHGFALGESVFGAATLDGESDMSTDGVEEFEIALVVCVFDGVMLDDEDADRGGWRFQRYAEPRGRRRTDELDFAESGEAIKFGLRDEHGVAGAKNKRGAATVELLRRRCGVKLVDEEWEVESVGVGIVERDDAIFGVDDFFESAVDAREKLVEIGGFVESVNDVGDDETLGFHALKIVDVHEAENESVDGGLIEAIADGDFEPAPHAVLALKAAAVLLLGVGR
jgi:hypothetical protein